jgi:Holliday junction resolvase RusA-like endonuclease
VRTSLEVSYPVLPPTSNKIYFRGTQLTSKARKYAEDFALYMRNYIAEISELDPNAVYAVHLRFYFPKLINPTYNDMSLPPSKRAKSRYKKIDLTNRIKLLEDCIRDALAIDDSQTFAASQEKHQCQPGELERVEIYVQQVVPELFGIPGEVPM